MAWYIGWLYCSLWYFSILSGYAGLYVPLLPIIFISNRLYRRCTDTLFTFWQLYPTILLEMLCGCDVQVSGDPILTHETSLLIMNHRTRTDCNFLWPALYHCTQGRGRYKYPTKFVLKNIIRHIPGPGWVMQLSCFVYIKRFWSDDKKTFKRTINYFSQLITANQYKFSMLVFPEGTDFTHSTKTKSDRFAKKNELLRYDYVLHPRTTGFVYLAREMMQKGALDAVYDVTLVYPDTVPQNESVLLSGDFPELVKIHLAKYPLAVLPKTEEGLKKFLEERWFNKEKTLKEYHVTGNFLHGKIMKNENRVMLLFALVFWTLLPIVVGWMIVQSAWFRTAVLIHSIFLVLVNLTSEGFQQFEVLRSKISYKKVNSRAKFEN